jgi:uncharacterized protein YcfJ
MAANQGRTTCVTRSSSRFSIVRSFTMITRLATPLTRLCIAVGLVPAFAVLSGCAAPATADRYPANVRPSYPVDAPASARRDYRRAPDERLFEAKVLSARAVMTAGGQRCWIEREDVPPPRSGANVPGALAGAVIGGILGHQIGGGSGRDLATVGGVVAGAAIGSQVGQSSPTGPTTQDVQRCSPAGGRDQIDYWDVTYEFRGVFHRVQLTDRPGSSVTVNARGEPRE